MKKFLIVLLVALTAESAQNKRSIFSLGYTDPYTTYNYGLPYIHPSYFAPINTIPISNYLEVQLPPFAAAAEKPVTEPTFEPPPPTDGASITVALPQTNVYSLGSGSLGAVQLNDGRLALGSGSLGYTQRTGGFLGQQAPISYVDDRGPQNFGLALPNPPEVNLNRPTIPETRGYASTPGLSAARS